VRHTTGALPPRHNEAASRRVRAPLRGDPAALEAHQKSAHGAKYFPLMRVIIEKIDVEYFDGVVD
jgi:hypothetical protein